MIKKNKFKSKKYLTIYILSLFLIISIIFNLILLNRKNTNNTLLDENIVFFGDSITNKYNVSEFFPSSYVVNSGISGDKTEDLLDRIDDDVYKYNPSKVFLLIGINDLNHGIDEDDIIDNIQKIVNGIKTNRKNTKIYIESIYPINRNTLNSKEYEFNNDITNDRLKKINFRIKKLCEENDIEYIDIFSKLLDDEGNLKESYTIEGLHLNDLGYFKVTNELNKYINKNNQC